MPPYVVTTKESLERTLKVFLNEREFLFDVESTGVHRGVPAVNEVTWLSMATRGATVVIPMGHPNGELVRAAHWYKDKDTKQRVNVAAQFTAPPPQLRPSQVFDTLAPLFVSDRVKIAHNAVFDLVSIAKHTGFGIPPPPYGDTIVAAWLLDENRPSLRLDALVKARYGVAWKDNVGKCVEAHAFGKVARYAWLDARMPWLLWHHYRPRIAADSRLESIWELEMGVLECLLHMQSTGAPIDVPALERLRADLRSEVDAHTADVYRAAGRIFNIGSVPQKIAVLYGSPAEGGQGLRPRKLTPTGAPSTDAEALASYAANPVVKPLLKYQETAKILGTYVDGYLGTDDKPGQIHAGRVYPTLAQYGTVSGRFSCRSPNVQNWPRPDTVWGLRIRDLFVPPPGFKMIVADYAQIELRILAHFAGKGALWNGFWDGLDAHVATAALIFGVAPEDVTKAQRQVAKALAFAIIYGAGPDLLAVMAHVPHRAAVRFMDDHERLFPEVYTYKTRLMRTVRGRRPLPHLYTLLGRMRRFPYLNSPSRALRSRAQRQVVNSHIQGSNADITKLAMVRLNRTRLPGMEIMLSVHDELVVLCPQEIVEEGAAVLHDAMAGPGMQLLSVPVTATPVICDRWSEAK